VKLELLRDGKPVTVDASSASCRPKSWNGQGCSRRVTGNLDGLTLNDLTPGMRRKLGCRRA
jgi:hypothetical protein